MELDPRRDSPLTHTSIPSRETPGVFAQAHYSKPPPRPLYISGVGISQGRWRHTKFWGINRSTLQRNRPPRQYIGHHDIQASSFKLEVQKQLGQEDSRMKVETFQERHNNLGIFSGHRSKLLDIPKLPLANNMGFEPAIHWQGFTSTALKNASNTISSFNWSISVFFWPLRQQARILDIPKLLANKMGFKPTIHWQGLTSTTVEQRLQQSSNWSISVFFLASSRQQARILDIPKLPLANEVGFEPTIHWLGFTSTAVEQRLQHYPLIQFDITVEKLILSLLPIEGRWLTDGSGTSMVRKMSGVWHNKCSNLLWRACICYSPALRFSGLASIFTSYLRSIIWVTRSARFFNFFGEDYFRFRFRLLGLLGFVSET